MDQPLYLLFGAGAIIVIAALFLRKSGKTNSEKSPIIHTSIDQTEIESTLKRFLSQVRQENDQTVTVMERNKHETNHTIRQLNDRVQHLEAELAQLRAIPQMTVTEAVLQKQPEEEKEEVDSLLLKERFKRVFELKQEGLELDEIAKRIGAGRGEIDLIFSLATPAQRGSTDD